MAVYRYIQTTFWQDAFVLELTPEEKYFYFYLLTNSKTSQCGIYELPKRIIEIDTGYNRETVDKLLKRFTEYGKIQYCEDTKEIMIKNWIKYNFSNSISVKACIKKELATVKNSEFIEKFYRVCTECGHTLDTVNTQCIESRHMVYTDSGEKEKEKQKEKQKQKEKETPPPQKEKQTKNIKFSKATELLKKAKPDVSEILIKKLEAAVMKYGDDMMVHAVETAINNDNLKWSYIQGILNNWDYRKINTLEKAISDDEARKTEKNKKCGGDGCEEDGRYSRADTEKFLYRGAPEPIGECTNSQEVF